MNPKLDKALCRKYPLICADRKGDPRQTLMCFGFECGDGWYWLLDNLFSYIQNRIENSKKPYSSCEIPQVVAVQIKEKFGGLRFSYSGGNEDIYAAVIFAEFLSTKICENCGSTENMGTTTKGWITSICKTCIGKDGRRRGWRAYK